eukprot:5781578-Pyramimonas_sp.AAC.1
METLAVERRRRGLVEASEMLTVFHFPSFAKWRWSTLYGCAKPISNIIYTLINAFDHDIFRGMRGTTRFST